MSIFSSPKACSISKKKKKTRSKKRHRSPRRCLTQTKITTQHPLQIKLQRKHRGNESQKKPTAARRSEAKFEVQPAQTGSRSGSYFLQTNTRRMLVVITGRWRLWMRARGRGGGRHIRAGGGPALILWTQWLSHSGVN